MRAARREIDAYGIVWRDGEQDSDGPWAGAFMRGRRARIEAGRPVIQIRPEWVTGAD